MNKNLEKTLNKLTLGQLFDISQEIDGTFWTYEDLKYFAINRIEDDNLNIAIHILNALNDDQEEYYNYDSTMGTLEEVTPITSKKDLIELLKNYYDEDIKEVLKRY